MNFNEFFHVTNQEQFRQNTQRIENLSAKHHDANTQKGSKNMLKWLEDIHPDYYSVDMPSLPSFHRDRERFGTVISTEREYVIIETDEGERLKWEDGRLLKLPEIYV